MEYLKTVTKNFFQIQIIQWKSGLHESKIQSTNKKTEERNDKADLSEPRKDIEK